MRIYTEVVIDIATGKRLAESYYEWDGAVALSKKGRGETEQATHGAINTGDTATSIANQNYGAQRGYAGTADPFARSLIPSASGKLSPYAAAQFAQNKADIDKTYAANNAATQRGLAARGFGAAPTGLSASLTNTNNRNAGEATTQAYQNALQNTLGQGLAGINYFQNQQQIYNPVPALNAAAGAYGTGISGGKAMNTEGSLLGDIGAGLGAFGGIV